MDMEAKYSQELLIQYASLRFPGHVPRGLYIAIVPQRRSRWQGILFLHKGYYKGAVFQFILKLDGCPETLPQVVFLSDVWHPLVNKEGQLNLAAILRVMQEQWMPATSVETDRPRDTDAADYDSQHSITQTLFAIKTSFKTAVLDRIAEADAYNVDAYSAYKEQVSLFAQLAKQCVQVSTSRAVLYREYQGMDLPVRLIDAEADVEKEDGVEDGERMGYDAAVSLARRYLDEVMVAGEG